MDIIIAGIKSGVIVFIALITFWLLATIVGLIIGFLNR